MFWERYMGQVKRLKFQSNCYDEFSLLLHSRVDFPHRRMRENEWRQNCTESSAVTSYRSWLTRLDSGL